MTFMMQVIMEYHFNIETKKWKISENSEALIEMSLSFDIQNSCEFNLINLVY